MLHKIFC